MITKYSHFFERILTFILLFKTTFVLIQFLGPDSSNYEVRYLYILVSLIHKKSKQPCLLFSTIPLQIIFPSVLDHESAEHLPSHRTQ